MKTIKDFEHLWAQIVTKNEHKIDEIQALRLELENFINDQDSNSLDSEQQDSLQSVLEEIRYKEQELNSNSLTSLPKPLPPTDSEERTFENNISEANKIMNYAEELFYSGRYSDAIKKYNQVLAVEPNWERAREHLNQANKNLREGNIPMVALPSEVAVLFGKAQSAARVGRYVAALELMKNAKEILAKYGIPKWTDGDEFISEIRANIEAEEIAGIATQSFDEGKIDEAIKLLYAAYRSSSHPKYKVLADKYESFKNEAQKISNVLYAPNVNFSSELFEALSDLEKLKSEFGDNPRTQLLTEKLELTKSNFINSVQQKIRKLLSEAEVSQTIDLAIDNVYQAKDIVDQAVRLGLTNEEFNYVSKEVNRKLTVVDSDQADLDQAEKLATEKASQNIAVQIILELHQRYPSDPRISKIRARLGIKSDLPYSVNPPPDDIDLIVQKAKELFGQKKIDQAIELLDYQYKTLRISRLRDLATEYKDVKRVIENLSNVIYSGNATEVIEASKTIVTLRDKYGDLPIPEPLLVKLNNQLLIYLINSKEEGSKQSTTASQDIVIQGLLGGQPAISFHEYYRVLNGMILKDPLNQRLQILLSWVKHEIDLNEKQIRNRVERNKSIDSFRNQAKVWFILSIVTAIAFLVLSIYIIVLSIQQDDVWIRLSSLFSILPVFISKLVYDQSLAATRRADEMYEKLMDEDTRNVDQDRLDEKDIRKKVFQQKPKTQKSKSQKPIKKNENDSDKDTSAS